MFGSATVSVPGNSHTTSYVTSLKTRAQSISYWTRNRAFYDLKNTPLKNFGKVELSLCFIHIKNNKRMQKKKSFQWHFKNIPQRPQRRPRASQYISIWANIAIAWGTLGYCNAGDFLLSRGQCHTNQRLLQLPKGIFAFHLQADVRCVLMLVMTIFLLQPALDRSPEVLVFMA